MSEPLKNEMILEVNTSDLEGSPETSFPYNLNFHAQAWQHYFDYEKVDGALIGICRKCLTEVPRTSGSTNGLKSHLKSCFDKAFTKREVAFNEKLSNEKSTSRAVNTSQPKITQAFEVLEKLNNNHPQSRKIDLQVLQWMCLNCEPLNKVEGEGFAEMFSLLNPKYVVKGRTFMTKLLDDQYLEHFSRLVTKLEHISHFALTTDGWSSKNGKVHFLSVTAHYIDEKFERQFAILSSTPIEKQHTAETYSTAIKEVLSDSKIPFEKIHLILRDAANVMKKTTKMLGFKSFDCFLHKVQLAINDGLKIAEIEETLKTVRNLVTTFNKSETFRSDFYSWQEKVGLKKDGLIQDVKSRWNSTFYMLERIRKNRLVIGAMSADKSYSSCVKLELEVIDQIFEVLRPFEEFTESLSSRNASISSVIPAYCSLKCHLSMDAGKTPLSKKFKEAIFDGLTSRMDAFESYGILLVATLIDPRYKDAYFDTEETLLARKCLMTEISSSISTAEPDRTPILIPSPTKKPRSTMYDLLHFAIVKKDNSSTLTSIEGLIKKEIDVYLDAPRLDEKTDPLAYWKAENNFPMIKKLVKRFLCPPPSSVESERLFSTMGRIYDDKRYRLSDDRAKAQLFLHHHWWIMKDC